MGAFGQFLYLAFDRPRERRAELLELRRREVAALERLAEQDQPPRDGFAPSPGEPT